MDTLEFQIYDSTNQVWEWKKAYQTFGVMMDDGFLDALMPPIPLKPFVTNKSRLIDGERIVISNPRKDSRSLTLSFAIHGNSKTDFQSKKESFYNYLYTGDVRIRFTPPTQGANDDRVTKDEFRFIYNGESVTYGEDLTHTSCKISIKLKEPNPQNRNSSLW